MHNTIVSNEWATRPDDERFVSLPDMLARMTWVRQASRTSKNQANALTVRPADNGALVLAGQSKTARPAHFAFTQLCSIAGFASSELRKLPAHLAAPILNHMLGKLDEEKRVQLLLQEPEGGNTDWLLRAVTGENYGRIWNHQIISRIISLVGDGVTGPWKVPGEFSRAVPITKENTTLYASAHDMLIMLADEENRITLPNRRNGEGTLARGVIVANSEVGADVLWVMSFLFDYVCCNRIIWGVENWTEVRIRHNHKAPERWITQLEPAVSALMSLDSRASDVHRIRQAQSTVIDRDPERVLEFLGKKADLSAKRAQGVWDAHLQDEGRSIATLWDASVGLTAYARTIPHADTRSALERKAGEILDLAA
jgi:hypothetical protein